MTAQQSRAEAFHALHIPGDPLVLFNIWDPGSAAAVAGAGAKALATGSASVGGARGYGDAEGVPLDEVLANAAAIVRAVDLPVSLDFEGGYAVAPDEVAANVARVIETGVVGINFEDQVIGGEGLHPVELQADRIAAIRRAADEAGVDFFINARTDVWLKAGRTTLAAEALFDEAARRCEAFAAAGASGFFVPGLADEEELRRICDLSPLPVNAMMFEAMPSPARLGKLGIARISHGPGPWKLAMEALEEAARGVYVD
ncbi:MAG: isocitrate lyase/phosphoenolpyruvate mutase family protein [Parasphingopyxis sp.]